MTNTPIPEISATHAGLIFFRPMLPLSSRKEVPPQNPIPYLLDKPLAEMVAWEEADQKITKPRRKQES